MNHNSLDLTSLHASVIFDALPINPSVQEEHPHPPKSAMPLHQSIKTAETVTRLPRALEPSSHLISTPQSLDPIHLTPIHSVSQFSTPLQYTPITVLASRQDLRN